MLPNDWYILDHPERNYRGNLSKMQNMEKINLKKTNLHLMFPNYILFTSEKRKKKTPRERGENYQKQKWKWKQKMFARGKHAPDKNKQNSLCIYVFIIFPLGTFAQLKLEGGKKQISH